MSRAKDDRSRKFFRREAVSREDAASSCSLSAGRFTFGLDKGYSETRLAAFRSLGPRAESAAPTTPWRQEQLEPNAARGLRPEIVLRRYSRDQPGGPPAWRCPGPAAMCLASRFGRRAWRAKRKLKTEIPVKNKSGTQSSGSRFPIANLSGNYILCTYCRAVRALILPWPDSGSAPGFSMSSADC